MNTDNTLNYANISNFHLQRNPQWANALQNATGSIENELSSQLYNCFYLPIFMNKLHCSELTSDQKTYVCAEMGRHHTQGMT
jgi:hypothetical protein